MKKTLLVVVGALAVFKRLDEDISMSLDLDVSCANYSAVAN